MPGALAGAGDSVGKGETSVIAGKCDGTGFRRGGLTPPADAEDERLSPATPDPAFAGREETEVKLARGWDTDVGCKENCRLG